MNPSGVALWVAEHADVALADATAVLTVEAEYMHAVGIVAWTGPGPDPFEYRYYDPADLAGETGVVDTLRLARDAEALAGVPEATAHAVFLAELEYMEMRGLA